MQNKITGKRAVKADATKVEPSQWSRGRTALAERMEAESLHPAQAGRFEGRPELARWYCVSVNWGCEFAVEGKLSKAGVEVFLPREKFDIVKGGKKIEGERPLFKGYLFVRIVPFVASFMALRRVKKVRDILGNGEVYQVVPNAHIDVFKRVFEKVDVERMPVDRTIGQGSKARITHGHFAGRNCVVLQVTGGRNPRVRVCVDGFGEFAHDVKMDLAFLRKL